MKRRILCCLALGLSLLAPAGLVADDAKPAAPAKAPVKREAVKTADDAVEYAGQQKKMIFILLGRKACPNCEALRKSLKSGVFRLEKNKFEWVELNVDDGAANGSFQKRFHVAGGKLPYVAITDGEGASLATASGYLGKGEFDKLVAAAKAAAKAKSGK